MLAGFRDAGVTSDRRPGDEDAPVRSAATFSRTALEKFARLEAVGHLRSAPGADPLEVVVRFGTSTLVLTDLADRPLAHWALAGVLPVGGKCAGVFAMSQDASETLTITDPEMIDAIETVTLARKQAAHAREAPVSSRLIRNLLATGCVAMMAFWTPELLRTLAIRMTPPESVEEIGQRMLLQLMAEHGALCSQAAGHDALGRLAKMVGAEPLTQIRAMELGGAPFALLPGPIIVIAGQEIAEARDASEIAGWIALALAREQMRPGVERLAISAGPVGNLRSIFAGSFDGNALEGALANASAPPDLAEVNAAYERLLGAGMATEAFAARLERDHIPHAPATPAGSAALSDQQWVALQNYCR